MFSAGHYYLFLETFALPKLHANPLFRVSWTKIFINIALVFCNSDQAALNRKNISKYPTSLCRARTIMQYLFPLHASQLISQKDDRHLVLYNKADL